MSQHPAPSGITFRALRDASDYHAMRAVREACIVEDRVDVHSAEERLSDVAALATTWPLTGDHTRTLLLAEHDDVVVAYHYVRWWTHSAGTTYAHRGYVLPAWRGQGIGTTMLRWAEKTLQAEAARHDPALPVVFRAYLSEHEHAAHALLLAEGYVHTSSLLEFVHDLRDIPVVKLPEGFELRPAVAREYRAIWEANEAIFRDEPQRSPPDEAAFDAFVHDSGADPSLWQVIWVGDAIAGLAICERAEDNVGHIVQLGVRESWRRRSLGRALVMLALNTLQRRECSQARVCTDADGLFGAGRLYETVGFRRIKEFRRYSKQLLR